MNFTTIRQKIRRWDEYGAVRFAALIFAVSTILFVASNVTVVTQFTIGVTCIAAMTILRLFEKRIELRFLFLCIGAFLSFDYLFWRTFTTLTYYDLVSFTLAITLYLGELYGIIIYFLSIFVNIAPFDRKPTPLPENVDEWPTVDVLIPTYNEEREILEVTMLAALAIDYPADKLNVYLCDDGGTDQHCNSSDPNRAAKARARRKELKELCEQAGSHYMTRAKNIHAKAGNLNNALEQSTGDLILILDADHIPTVDILKNTVGIFLTDPKMFLVQTPHFFTNPDPIEKNLKTWRDMPSESEMFYKQTQKGLDSWNSAFFCGSAAVMRREHIMDVGGIVGETITEDAETALTLHARGLHSAYIGIPMISGLSPETLGGFITQRIRWAQGMVQIFLLKNALFMPGLTVPQRLCYFSSSFFWFFPFARLIFCISPAAFLIFSLKIYDANFTEFLAFAVPHLIGVFMVSDYLFGKVRWAFVSELYELMQSVYTFPAIIRVFLNPRAPSFNVTAKGEILDRDFISPLSKPFYVLMAINIVALFAGGYRMLFTAAHQFATGITMFWAFFNIFVLLACLGALLERRQRRVTARMKSKIPATLVVGEKELAVEIRDMSNGGCSLCVDPVYESLLSMQSHLILRPSPTDGREHGEFNLQIRNLRYWDWSLMAGCEFDHGSIDELKRKIAFVNGSSARWVEFQASREKGVGVWGGAVYLMRKGVAFTLEHMGLALLGRFRKERAHSRIAPVARSG